MRDLSLARISVFARIGRIAAAVSREGFFVSHEGRRKPGLHRSLRAAAWHAHRACEDHMRAMIAALSLLAIFAAGVLVLAQQPFDRSEFEYQQYRPHSGIIEPWPYPVLVENGRRYLLSGAGKHGFDDVAEPVSAHLMGALIHRAEGQM